MLYSWNHEFIEYNEIISDMIFENLEYLISTIEFLVHVFLLKS